jgi:hypothetical protein
LRETQPPSIAFSEGRPALLLPSWRVVCWIATLLLICYAPVLYRLVLNWVSDPDMGHGFFVPIVVAFIVWQRRSILAKLPKEPNVWGLVLVVLAGFQALAAILGGRVVYGPARICDRPGGNNPVPVR